MERLVQSKWVRWNTLKESKESHVNDGMVRYPKRFCNQDLSAGAIDAFRGAMDEDHIGEFQVVNEDGLIYTFGIPVLVRNQVECSFSIPHGITPSSGALEDYKVVMADAPAIGKYLAGHQTIEEVLEDHESDIITGRIVEPAIATSYLLTSIVSPDYVDLTLDGPTEDDLGTWVKFEYVKDFEKVRPPVGSSTGVHSGAITSLKATRQTQGMTWAPSPMERRRCIVWHPSKRGPTSQSSMAALGPPMEKELPISMLLPTG